LIGSRRILKHLLRWCAPSVHAVCFIQTNYLQLRFLRKNPAFRSWKKISRRYCNRVYASALFVRRAVFLITSDATLHAFACFTLWRQGRDAIAAQEQIRQVQSACAAAEGKVQSLTAQNQQLQLQMRNLQVFNRRATTSITS
jgi:hypothetical protein